MLDLNHIKISKSLSIPFSEIEITAICSSGPGGQNVNKVSTGIHLRFDILESSMSEYYKQKLLKLKDSRISEAGVVNIKAQQYRTQSQNKADAFLRFTELLKKCTVIIKKRIASKPSKTSQTNRLEIKKKKGQTKMLRNKYKVDS